MGHIITLDMEAINAFLMCLCFVCLRWKEGYNHLNLDSQTMCGQVGLVLTADCDLLLCSKYWECVEQTDRHCDTLTSWWGQKWHWFKYMLDHSLSKVEMKWVRRLIKVRLDMTMYYIKFQILYIIVEWTQRADTIILASWLSVFIRHTS